MSDPTRRRLRLRRRGSSVVLALVFVFVVLPAAAAVLTVGLQDAGLLDLVLLGGFLAVFFGPACLYIGVAVMSYVDICEDHLVVRSGLRRQTVERLEVIDICWGSWAAVSEVPRVTCAHGKGHCPHRSKWSDRGLGQRARGLARASHVPDG